MSSPAKPAARAIADLNAGIVLATVDIAVPPERVFRALTTDEVTKWWGSDEMYRTTSFTADVRVGGKWRSEGKGSDGEAFHVEGEYLEVDPPHTLVHTWKPSFDDVGVTTVRYSLEAIATGTRVTLHHEGFGARRESCAGHGSGWERVLGWLGAHLTPGAAESFFLVRLIAPRPTFLQDMTDDEKMAMMRHAGYWRELLGVGTAVVFGPVADPKGPWGLGVVRAADAAAIKALEAGDPAVTSIGMHYEVTPMLTAVHR